MAKEDDLVQVNLSLSRSHVPLLPEIMRVISTARRSDYSWDSMKLSVKSDVEADEGSRIIINLSKSQTETSEIVVGKIHKCHDQVCKHDNNWKDIVGDVKMTSYADQTLDDYLKIQKTEEEGEIEGTGWLEKEISDEMFYPSWYDHIRMKGACQLGDDNELVPREVFPLSSAVIVRSADVHPFFEERSNWYPFRMGREQENEEICRLRKVFNRAKEITPYQDDFPPEIEEGKITSANPMKSTIRHLKERHELQITSTEHCNHLFSNYHRYDDELSTFPIVDPELKRYQDPFEFYSIRDSNLNDFPTIKHETPNDFRKIPYEEPKKPSPQFEAESMLKEQKGILRSFSAREVPKRWNGELFNCQDNLENKNRLKHKRRPKSSGPEKKVGFNKLGEKEFLELSSRSLTYKRTPAISMESLKKSPQVGVTEESLSPTKKEKRRKKYKELLTNNYLDPKELPSLNQDKEFKDNMPLIDEKEKRRWDEHKYGDQVGKLKSSEDIEVKEIMEKIWDRRPKSSKEENELRIEYKRRKAKMDKKLKEVDDSLNLHYKTEEKSQKKEKYRKDDVKEKNQGILKNTVQSEDIKSIADAIKVRIEEKGLTDIKSNINDNIEKIDVKREMSRSWRNGFFLGKRVSPATTINDPSSSPCPPDALNVKGVDGRKDLSFMELLSAMTDEVKQLGRRRGKKKNFEK